MTKKAAAIEQLLELLKSEDESLLLTIPETAEKLGVSERTVQNMIAAGDLRAVDIALSGAKYSKTRVRRDDLDAYIDARTKAAS